MEKHTVDNISETENGNIFGEKQHKEQDPQEKKKKYISICISVVIAVGLWFFVINDENPTIKMTYTCLLYTSGHRGIGKLR